MDMDSRRIVRWSLIRLYRKLPPPPAGGQVGNPAKKLVDPPGIEPGPRQCECRVIPLYYGPLGPQVFARGMVRMFPSRLRLK